MSATLEVTTIQNTLEVTIDGTTHTLEVQIPASVELLEVGNSGAVSSVNGQTGAVVLDKSDVGLPNVDNTSDANKPVSTLQAAADVAATNNAISTLRNNVATAGDDLAKLYALIQAINTIIGGTSPDGDSVTNTVAEILAVMATYPEGVDVLQALNDKINVSAIINTLTETASGKVLDARQGKALKDLIDALTSTVSGKADTSAVNSALNGKVDANSAITGATKTKVTYDAKGLVTNGADATTADINDSTNRRYVTDAQQTVIGNTSGTNTGDETTATILAKQGFAVWKGFISQSGTNNPTLVELVNTIGAISAVRLGSGEYYLTSSGLFTAGKTFLIPGDKAFQAGGGSITTPPPSTGWIDADQIYIGTAADGGLQGCPILIEVYP